MSQPSPIAGPQLLIPLPATPMPSPYFAIISWAVSFAAASSRSTQTMCAPSFTNRCAVALPIEFFLRRQTAELGFFQIPVLDVEGLLLIHRFVLVDGFRATHDFDGAV